MHFGTGALLGALSGIWAAMGLRGPRAYLAHTVTRIAFDQTVENATGVGVPPSTWPPVEQATDLLHKAVYSLTTSLICRTGGPPALGSAPGPPKPLNRLFSTSDGSPAPIWMATVA